MDNRQLIQKALEVREYSYCPYSKFAVGAALLGKSGKIYLGCNVESVAYSPTNCAERTAFYTAIAEGERAFDRIAIVGAAVGQIPDTPTPPCGVCLQVMAEFCDPKTFTVVLINENDQPVEHLLCDLLPLSFGSTFINN